VLLFLRRRNTPAQRQFVNRAIAFAVNQIEASSWAAHAAVTAALPHANTVGNGIGSAVAPYFSRIANAPQFGNLIHYLQSAPWPFRAGHHFGIVCPYTSLGVIGLT
jgi:hypothetical protein